MPDPTSAPLLKPRSGKNSRILFALPEGDMYAREFSCIARSLPEYESRFVGVSWSTGRLIRKSEFQFAYLPWHSAASNTAARLPPVAELVATASCEAEVPAAISATYGELVRLLETLFEQFDPDIVVHGPIEHAVCYEAERLARFRGVKHIGIQPSFLNDHFIVNEQGSNWEHELRAAQIPESASASEECHGTSIPLPRPRAILRRRTLRSVWMWIRGAEYAMRTAVGAYSFHSIRSLFSLLKAYLAPELWFPELKTLNCSDAPFDGDKCVLVALNRAPLRWSPPSCEEVIAFALSAVPANIPIVLRPHPSEHPTRLSFELVQELRARGVMVSRATTGPLLADVLAHCRAVLTVNSAVGMEALTRGIPVFSLGSAFYARSGMAYDVTLEDAARVREILMGTNQRQSDARLVTDFVEWIVRSRMVPSPSSGSDALAERIRAECSMEARRDAVHR